jgi:hypothetical protein
MSIHAPNPVPAKAGSPFLAFLFLAVLAAGFVGAALVLGTEPRLAMERGADGILRATGSNHFAGLRFFSKTIEGVKEVTMDNAVRDGRRDPEKVNRKRRRDLHLDILAANGSRLGWDRESDLSVIEKYLRSAEASLALADPPPVWRMGLAWFLAGFGGLTFLGAIQSFFPKKGDKPGGSGNTGNAGSSEPYVKI